MDGEIWFLVAGFVLGFIVGCVVRERELRRKAEMDKLMESWEHQMNQLRKDKL